MKLFSRLFILALLSGLALAEAQACTVCGAEAGQKASDAASLAIGFLLIIILLVIGGIGSVVASIMLRTRKLNRAAELSQALELKPHSPL